MSRSPVVVTGLGAVCGLGVGVDAAWQAALAGRHAIRPLELFATTGHRTTLAAAVPGDAALVAGRGLSRAERFACTAAAEAVRSLPAASLRSARAGVFFGSSTGALFEAERFLAELLQHREGDLAPLAAQQNDGPGAAVARHLGVRGPVATWSTACTSANLALGAALDALQQGEVDVAIAGGADELCETTYAGFNSLRAVDAQPTRPFRRSRAGLSLGEGAGVLLLETRAHAVRRGATVLCELVGAGRSCDAHHVSAPDPDGAGAAQAMRAALHEAGLAPDAVTFVNAHGTGTPHNDGAEARAMHAVFGARARSLPVTSSKSLVGHLLGAAGGIEAVFTALSIVHRLLPPVAGDEPADPELGLDVVLGAPRALPAHNVGLSTNLAFGGNNAVVLLRSQRP
ncbi:MAG: beta-ketoacyl-[acyl-carrier-protein] synthase family protein [Planctomycetes bacterium]|nr:beta-ketoacyl-[acyl-carrier-protein] synthase family protein [Planctomycetota bacterium]